MATPKSNFQPQQHLVYMLGKIRRSLSADPKVEAGNVVQFRYSKAKTDMTPLILITNVNFRGELHGINLNYMNRQQAKTIGNRMGMFKRYKQKKAMIEAYDKNYPLVRLQMRESKSYYDGTIKPLLKTLFKYPSLVYRTYSVSLISNVQLIDYDWGLEDRKFREQVIEWEREDALSAEKDAQVGEGISEAEADKD